MEESLLKIKAVAALLHNMVSTVEDVRYNDLALFYIAKLLYEGIDELECILTDRKKSVAKCGDLQKTNAMQTGVYKE